MPIARPETSETRVIAHVDLDCFYVQVEQRKNPVLRGKPTAVVQYNSWKGGGLIAVGYEARYFGVTRNMRGDEAKKACPEIELIQVPVAHGKADLTQYRDAGSEVVAILAQKGICERASIDEVYLDITEASAALSLQQFSSLPEPLIKEVLKSHILGYSEGDGERQDLVRQWLCNAKADSKERMLACGAIVVAQLRLAVLAETSFTCSAGIAHNKMLAKLASGMHKPAQQTLVPSSSVSDLLAKLPIKNMKQLGGKLGDSLKTDLKVSYIGDLLQFPESKLQDMYGVNTGTWLWSVARGVSGDEVKARTLPKSHSCGKTFPGPKSLKSLDAVGYWLKELAAELQERLDIDLEQNHRTAHLLTLHAGTAQGYKTISDKKFPSKSCMLRYGKEKIAEDAIKLFERALREFCVTYHQSPRKKDNMDSAGWAVTSLFIGASNIWATPAGMNPITHFFSSPSSPSTLSLKGSPSLSTPLSPSVDCLIQLEPLSPNAAPSSDDEAIGIACRASDSYGYGGEKGSVSDSNLESNLYTSAVLEAGSNMQPESDGMISNWRSVKADILLEDERLASIACTGSIEINQLTGTPMASMTTPSSSLKGDNDMGVDGAQKNMDNASCDYHCRMRPDPSDCIETNRNLDGDEFTCTPTFGNFEDVKALPCALQIPAAGSYTTACSVDSDPLEKEDLENNSSLVIHCSPIEQGEYITETNSIVTFHQDDGCSKGTTILGRNTSRINNRQQSGILKLKDIWQRKISSPSASGNVIPQVSNNTWNYRQEDIDETVLSELPDEIQAELYESFGFKRPRVTKRGSIGDFFRGSTPTEHLK